MATVPPTPVVSRAAQLLAGYSLAIKDNIEVRRHAVHLRHTGPAVVLSEG